MTNHQCQECMGEGGWPGFDGEWRDCPDCYGWGNVDDGEPADEEPADDDEFEPAWPTVSDRIQFGY